MISKRIEKLETAIGEKQKAKLLSDFAAAYGFEIDEVQKWIDLKRSGKEPASLILEVVHTSSDGQEMYREPPKPIY